MQFKALFFLSALVLGAVASPTEVVKYGSGSTLGKRGIGSCNIEPGAVCGGLATACAGAITDKDANLIWQIAVCAVAGLWCGGQAILNILCCFEKIPSCKSDKGGLQYTGPKDVDVNSREVAMIASYHDSGPNFSAQGLLHFIQGNGGGDILNNKERMGVIDDIMHKLTGSKSKTATANVDEVNKYLKGSNVEHFNV